ncbi:hypothetical protein EVAR_94462_1 [Eumeta japonica]|uniref:Uncharacterized protein n=1 Tax=Eumeta variegata TaxID=151549 RepID=A0A4C1ZSB6_EUMVA|nr:hypothetical protein EVAR_94462_1 [Eumeta japonica]
MRVKSSKVTNVIHVKFWAARTHPHLCESEVIISPTHKPNGGWRDSVYFFRGASLRLPLHHNGFSVSEIGSPDVSTRGPTAPFTYVCIELAASLVRLHSRFACTNNAKSLIF